MIKLKSLITEGKYYGSADWKKMVKDIVNYKPAPRDLQGLHKVIQWVFDDSVFKLTDKNGKYMMDDLRKQPKLKKLFKEGKLTEKVMKIKYYKTVSKEEWNKTHKNYKSVIDGVKYLMVLDPQKGTILAPVRVK